MSPKTKTAGTRSRKPAARKATPNTDSLSVSERIDRIEAALGGQLGVKLSNYDDEAIVVAANPEGASHTSRPLTDSERLARLEVAAAGAGIRLYAKE